MAQLRETVRAAFAHYDTDGSGAIDATELRSLVADLGGYLTDKEFKVALASLDRDGNGVIDENEFTEWWTAQSGDLDGDGQMGELERAMDRVKACGQDRFRVDIHSAAWRGSVDGVQRLLQDDDELVHEADATEYGGGNTALHYAAYQGHVEVCKLLIAGGAKVNAINACGCTPLLFAAQQSRLAVVTLLVEHGADIRIAEKQHQFTAVDVCFSDEILTTFRARGGGVPCVPDAPRITATLETSISIEWATPKDKHDQIAPISGYKLRATPVDSTTTTAPPCAVLVGAVPTHHTIERLESNTMYMLQLAAINLHGISAFSVPSETTRTRLARPRPPTQLRARSLDAASIEITWTTTETTDVVVAHFIVQQSVDALADLWKVVGKVDATDGDAQWRLVVSNLLDASKFRFRVAAISAMAGQSDFSSPIEARTRAANGDDAKLTPRVAKVGAGGKARIAVRDVVGVVHKLHADAKQHVAVGRSQLSVARDQPPQQSHNASTRTTGAVKSGLDGSKPVPPEPTVHTQNTAKPDAKKHKHKDDSHAQPHTHNASKRLPNDPQASADEEEDDDYVYFSDDEKEEVKL